MKWAMPIMTKVESQGTVGYHFLRCVFISSSPTFFHALGTYIFTLK